MEIGANGTSGLVLSSLERKLLRKIEAESAGCPMVSIPLVRQWARVTRARFDDAILTLMQRRFIHLYRCDLPRRLMSDYERDGMLWVGIVAYNACSIRRP